MSKPAGETPLEYGFVEQILREPREYNTLDAHPAQNLAILMADDDLKGPCPNMERCPMFPIFKMQSTLNFWIETRCKTDTFSDCERYKRFKARKPVPNGLLPNGKMIDGSEPPE